MAKTDRLLFPPWHARSDFILAVTGWHDFGEAPTSSTRAWRDGFEMIAMRYDLSPEAGSGSWTMMRLAPDVKAVITSTTYARRIDVLAPGEGYLELHYRLSGRMVLDGDDHADGVDLDRPCLLMQRQAEGFGVVEHIEPGRHDSSVTLYLKPPALCALLATELTDLPQPLRDMCSDDAAVRRYRTTLTPTLARPVLALASIRTEGTVGMAHADAFARQALCEVAEALRLTTPVRMRASAIHTGDVERLRQARDLLDRNHCPPPTIPRLARAVGLSATKLKVGFRQLFGQTIHAHASELRLRTALRLVDENRLRLGQVSEQLGFEHQSAFNLFFKRHLGMTPNAYRLQKVRPPPV